MWAICRPRSRRCIFPHAELIGARRPDAAQLADRLEGKLPNAGALLPLRDAHPGAPADRADGKPLPADAAAHRP